MNRCPVCGGRLERKHEYDAFLGGLGTYNPNPPSEDSPQGILNGIAHGEEVPLHEVWGCRRCPMAFLRNKLDGKLTSYPPSIESAPSGKSVSPA